MCLLGVTVNEQAHENLPSRHMTSKQRRISVVLRLCACWVVFIAYRATKAQMSLHIRKVSPEPSLLSLTRLGHKSLI